MASTPSFETLMLVLLGATMLVGLVISDVLEEQLLGRTRRERQRAVKQRERSHRAKRVAPDRAVTTLPRARVYQRS
jgi:hypothetical protein